MSKKKKGPHYTRKEVERAMLARMAKNGITAEDLDKFYKRGYRDGSHEALQQAAPTTYKTLFAAMAIVGKARRWTNTTILKYMQDVYEACTEQLSSYEAIEEAYNKTGIVLDFGEMMPVLSREEGKEC